MTTSLQLPQTQASKSKRAFNFNAGPGALPLPVLERISEELLDWRGSGMSVMEMSHRSPEFESIIADAEAGFGGNLNAFELTKALIRAGAAAVHFEDQLSSAKKCGHLGGKVLVSTSEAINKLVAARLAADE